MNKPLPWNVKGVGFDAREAARLAAKRAGMPLGEWLNGIISTRAAELGVQVDDVEADDRLEAIAARLSESENEAVSAPHEAGDGVRSHDAQASDRTGRPSVLPPSRSLGEGRQAAATAGLAPGPAMDASMSASPTDRLPSIHAHFAQTATSALNTRPDPLLANLAGRGFERRRTGTSPAKAVPVTTSQADAARLDERLNTILAKLNRSFEAAAEIGETFAGPGQDTGKTETKRVAGQERQPAAPTSLLGKAEPARPQESAPRMAPRAAEFSDLHAAFKSLAEKLEAQLAGSPVGTPTRVDAPAGLFEPARQTKAANTRTLEDRERAAEIQNMQRELAQLATHVAELTPQRSLASLETVVRELAGRLDLLRLDGVQASLLAPVERLGKDMREAIRSTDATAAVDGVRRDMKALAARLEAQPARHADNGAIASLQGDLRDLRGTVATLAERMSASERLENEIAALGERIGTLADRAAPTVSRDLAQAIGDIRNLLQAFEPHAGLGALDQKIDHLSARIESIAGARSPDVYFSDMMQQIDRAHEALLDRLPSRGTTRTDLSGIEEGLGALSAKIDTMGRASQDVSALYGLVGNLADRMQDVRDPQADGQAFAALQAQIGQLVQRLDRSDADHATLHGLERLIGDLFLQIEQSRNAAIDAAENAARAAAQDTLRAAMVNPSLNGAELTVQTGLDVDHVSQELAELRRVQEVADRRITGTLTALNTTLERLVDHMVATPPASPPVEEAAIAEKAVRRRRRILPEASFGGTRPASDLPPFDPEQFLLEPGTPGPLGQGEARGGEATAPVPQVGSDGGASVAPLIAAARRAAQAAQDSALEASLKPARGGADQPLGTEPSKLRSFFANRRRPLLLALAGVVLLLGTLQIVRLSTDSGAGDVVKRTPTASETSPPAAGPAPQNKGASLLVAPLEQQASSPALPSAATLDPTPTGSVPPATSLAELAALTGLNQGLKDLASGGNAPAQFEVASRLSDGKGVSRDTKVAASWFERAAKQGLAPAQYRLGSVYEKGVGVTADPALAVAWYEKAAGKGNIRAMHNLAVMSAEGAGAKPDYGKAVSWFIKAASYGVRDSQYNLAVLFARGLGVPQNLGQSYAWFALAAQQGDADAVAKRDTVAAKLDAKALAEAKATVASFHPLTADPAANDVVPPPGGWDAAAPGKTTASRKVEARVSSM